MGCWNETCMVSRLPILYGLRCCGVLAVHTGENNNMSYTTNAYKPISPIFEGEYDDYGFLFIPSTIYKTPKVKRTKGKTKKKV